MSDDEVFEYEIEIPATTAKIKIPKSDIYEVLEERLERKLTEEEKKTAWDEFSSHDNFYNMFPNFAYERGIIYYGADEYTMYNELFESRVHEAIQETIDDVMDNLWDNIFQVTLDDVRHILAKDAEKKVQVEMTTLANPIVYPTPLPPSPTTTEADNKYIEFLKEQHPLVKAANPTWTPQQIIVAIGHKWSFEQMTVEKKSGNIRVKHKTGKVTIDSCGKPDELKVFLDAYRAKHGHEAFFEFAKKLGTLE
jgi:hypothetical protein